MYTKDENDVLIPKILFESNIVYIYIWAWAEMRFFGHKSDEKGETSGGPTRKAARRW